jgi:hypothetical protein
VKHGLFEELSAMDMKLICEGSFKDNEKLCDEWVRYVLNPGGVDEAARISYSPAGKPG